MKNHSKNRMEYRLIFTCLLGVGLKINTK